MGILNQMFDLLLVPEVLQSCRWHSPAQPDSSDLTY